MRVNLPQWELSPLWIASTSDVWSKAASVDTNGTRGAGCPEWPSTGPMSRYSTLCISCSRRFPEEQRTWKFKADFTKFMILAWTFVWLCQRFELSEWSKSPLRIDMGLIELGLGIPKSFTGVLRVKIKSSDVARNGDGGKTPKTILIPILNFDVRKQLIL